MKNVIFLCSGNGGNLKFLKSVVDLGLLPGIDIVGVVSDRECGALDYALSKGIKGWIADFSERGQGELRSRIEELDPGIIVTNIHKILFTEFVRAFEGRLLNLHYSLLPAFPGVIGAKPVDQAIAYGAKWVGATAHYVDETVDTGKPVAQAVMPLFDGDTTSSVMDIIFRAGCLSLFSAFNTISSAANDNRSGGITLTHIKDRQVAFNPAITLSPTFNEEDFWNRLKS